ncbi:MAG: phospholipase D-like domain-containing protein [Simkaniaceae bacterium]
MIKFFILLGLFAAALYSETIKTYFSPNDHLDQRLIELIDGEKCAIYGAVYSFTNQKIGSALERAKERGVHVQLICDSTAFESRYPASKLAKKGIQVECFDGELEKKANRALMHHKFCLFKENQQGKKLVWTGSYNWTYKASKKNAENAVVFQDEKTYDAFLQEFKQMSKKNVIR